MFDRAQPSKRAKTWRADPGLLSLNSSRGFASTRWGDGDDGFMVDDIKRTKDGFALDEYAQVPLSPQAIKALKQLQALDPDENDGIYVDDLEAPEKFHIETWNANAHLPFVVDAYEFDDELVGSEVVQETTSPETQTAEVSEPKVQPVAATSDALQAAVAEQAAETDAGIENAASLEEQTAEIETSAEAVETAEALEATEQIELEAMTDESVNVQAQTETEAEAEAEAETETEAHAEAELEAEITDQTETAPEASVETDLVESDLTDENAVAPEQMAASVEDVVDDITLPKPALAGIAPDVAEQRAAEKFAEGLAQGIEQGERQAREAMQQEVQAQCTVLANVTQELHALLKDSKAFYEPLKRLTLHLAEQIVMGELRISTHAIEQLIQRCLDELDHPAQGLVVLELNPEDKIRLQAQSPELVRGMRLEAVQDLQPGSVRLFANDTVVEDLVEHRLEALAQSMLVDVATWRAQSSLAKPEASTQDLESEDVHP